MEQEKNYAEIVGEISSLVNGRANEIYSDSEIIEKIRETIPEVDIDGGF